MNYQEESRKEWTPIGRTPTVDELSVGALQRIATAAEKMAASYDAMRESRDIYKRWYEEERECRQAADRRITALKGVITRLRRRPS